ncbi:MAG: GWxTD domain-containing protein [Thermoanaerobaculia bacterium]
MKSSWISSAAPRQLARSALSLLLALLPSTAQAGRLKLAEPEEVTNLFLSPQHSRWLVGPISQIATRQEIASYLELHSDQEADRFIERFWARRGPEVEWPKKGVRQLFEERAREADKLFSEAVYLGQQTHRGTIYVLYGPPEETRFEVSAKPGAPTVEIWSYPKGTEAGLDGRSPSRTYRFAKRGDLTVFYLGPIRRSLTFDSG